MSPRLQSAGMAIAVTSSAQSLLVGQQLTYTLNVINNGPDAAPSATVTDVLPQALLRWCLFLRTAGVVQDSTR